MQSEFYFRTLRATDGDLLFSFFSSLSKKSKKTFQPHPFTIAFVRKIVSDYHSNLRLRLVVVSKKTESIIGYAFLHRQPFFLNHAYFGIAVSDKFQGKGIGSKLLAQLLKYGKEQGVENVFLNVYSNNANAVAVYYKIGFSLYEPSFFFKKMFTINELIYNGTFFESILKIIKNKKIQSPISNSSVVWMVKKI